ncbi:PD-(D/E)XK motif protein [Dyella amyloliquefaciens]|uniref:PD-(D/E)XK motif protein n=1 Tax=Dyella amyloliquefaciens TaxID=1770545 RepID=UPI00102ECBD0|nr:PD-(D/E)XK motif protein [Dyella amyloliquefaciens]
MAATQLLLSWPTLKEMYISKGVPFEQSVLADKKLSLVFDSDPGRLGIRVSAHKDRKSPEVGPLRNIVIRKVFLHGESYVEVLTEVPDLFRSIYALISDMLLRLQDEGGDCLEALALSLADFDALLERSTLLSREKVVGLYGELWVLELILKEGISSVDCWIGPQKQSHDFRLGSLELEVKTTTSNVRVHTIHDLNQLRPSPEHRLVLVSLTLGSAGSGVGRSLDELISDVRLIVTKDAVSSSMFEQMLKTSGYVQGEPECTARYQISAAPIGVEICVDFPSLSYDGLASALGSEVVARLSDFRFALNLEGLGNPFDVSQLMAQGDE